MIMYSKECGNIIKKKDMEQKFTPTVKNMLVNIKMIRNKATAFTLGKTELSILDNSKMVQSMALVNKLTLLETPMKDSG